MSEKDISILTSEMIANGIEDLKKRDILRELGLDNKMIFCAMGLPEEHPASKAIGNKIDQEILEALKPTSNNN